MTPRHLTRATAVAALTIAAPLAAPLAIAGPALAASPAYGVVCASAHVDAARNQTTTFSLSCEDTDGRAVDSYVVVGAPTKAAVFEVEAATGQVSYRPLAGATGTDTFTFRGVVDGMGQSGVTTAVVTLENQRPTCDVPAALTVAHDRSVEVPLTCSDADGDTLVLATGTTGASHGAVTVTGGVVSYTPADGFVGADSFTLLATDGDLASTEVPVSVSVTNARPTCTDARVRVRHDDATAVRVSCTDADGDALTPQVSARPQHGTVTVNGDTLVYRPAEDYLGRDTFSVVASDGLAASAPARVSVTVTNEAPECSGPRSFKVSGLTKVPVRCTDGDDDRLRIQVARKPKHGDLVVHGTKVSYRPDRGYRGTDTFSLRATDGLDSSRPEVFVAKVRSR